MLPGVGDAPDVGDAGGVTAPPGMAGAPGVVATGFLTGVGIQVAMGQPAGMLGVSGGTGGTLSKFFGTLEQIPDTSLATLAVSTLGPRA